MNNPNNSNAPQSSTREHVVAGVPAAVQVKIDTPVAPDDSPLSWVQKAVKTDNFSSQVVHQPEVVSAPELSNPNNTEPVVAIDSKITPPPEPSDLNPLQGREEIQTPPAIVTEEDDFDNATPVEVNFKKVRTKFKETKKELEDLRAKHQEVTTEVEDYRKGKKLPDALQNQEAEIARLRVFEKVHSLKTLNEFQQKFIEPLKEIDSLLKQAFRDYEIPEDEIDTFRGLRTEAAKNRFLEERFDTLKALEIKELSKKEGILLTGMKQAEKEPEQALTGLLQEAENKRLATAHQKRTISQERIREGWQKSLDRVYSDERFKTLKPQPGNEKYTQEVVKPIHTHAAQQSAQFFQLLLDAGLPEITPEIAEYVSYQSVLSHGAGLTLNQLTNTLQYVKTIEQNTARMNGVYRPPVGQGTGNPPQRQGPQQPMTAARAAEQLTQQVFGKQK